MRINSPYITGSATITGNLCVQGTILGTITGVASTASYAETLDGLDSTQFVQTGSFNSYTSSASSSVGSLSGSVATTTSGLSSSIDSLSGSIATTTLNLSSSVSSSIGSLSGSVATTTSGLGGRITTIEGRYATTGSNTFIGNQVITGSLYITTDLIVQGSSSLQNITASAVSIGTNTVILNTDTPAVRFAGISVQDSGSNVGVTGSIFWDGLCNKWVYSNPSGIGYSGGMLLSGPRTTTLGSESPLTCNYIAKSGGGDHLYDSCIQEVSGSVTIGGTLCTSGVVCGASGIFSSTSYSNLYLDGTNASGWGNNIAFKSQGTDFGYVGSIGSLVGSTTKDMTIWSTTGNGFRVYTNGNNPRLCIDSNGISTFACQVCTIALITVDLRYTGTGYITYDTSASGTSCLIFRQNGTEKMRISECGYLAVTGNEALSCVPYLQGMSFGWNRTNGQGESMINWTNAGGGSACDLVFNFRDSSTLYERLRIASTGAATFNSSISAASLSIGSTTNSTNPSVGSIISAGGLGLGGDIFMHPYNANQSNYGYIKTAATTVNTTTLTLGTTYGYATNVDAVSFFNGSATFNSSVTLTNSVFPVLTVQGTASSPHIGSTWSVSANQDGNGRTIIGTACQGRAMYFENSGDINIPNNTLSVGSTVSATQFFTATNSGTIQNNTATTIFTSSGGGGVWLVTYTIDGNTPQAGYAIVGNARGSTLYIYGSGVGSQTSLSVSGLNLQLTQTAGVALSYKYSAIKLNSI